MAVKLFGCVCGQFHSPGAGLGMAGDRVSVPVPFYVIEHPDGVAVFDCGLHADMIEADDPYRRRLRKQEMDVSLAPEETVTFRFGACKVIYYKQNDKGALTKQGEGIWNQIANSTDFTKLVA